MIILLKLYHYKKQISIKYILNTSFLHKCLYPFTFNLINESNNNRTVTTEPKIFKVEYILEIINDNTNKMIKLIIINEYNSWNVNESIKLFILYSLLLAFDFPPTLFFFNK